MILAFAELVKSVLSLPKGFTLVYDCKQLLPNWGHFWYTIIKVMTNIQYLWDIKYQH